RTLLRRREATHRVDPSRGLDRRIDPNAPSMPRCRLKRSMRINYLTGAGCEIAAREIELDAPVGEPFTRGINTQMGRKYPNQNEACWTFFIGSSRPARYPSRRRLVHLLILRRPRGGSLRGD